MRHLMVRSKRRSRVRYEPPPGWCSSSIEQGTERQKALLRRQAERRFGAAAAERLSAVLAEVTDADRLAEAGEWIVDCATPAEFLARVDRSGS